MCNSRIRNIFDTRSIMIQEDRHIPRGPVERHRIRGAIEVEIADHRKPWLTTRGKDPAESESGTGIVQEYGDVVRDCVARDDIQVAIAIDIHRLHGARSGSESDEAEVFESRFGEKRYCGDDSTESKWDFEIAREQSS
mgnify:CR=1 FL=1